MRQNLKAALLSGLVLPGVGQLYRGRTLKGGVMVLLVSILLLAVVILLFAAMSDLMHAARNSGGMDPALLAGRLRTWAPAAFGLGGAFFCLWAYGVIDALLDSGEEKQTAVGARKSERREGTP